MCSRLGHGRAASGHLTVGATAVASACWQPCSAAFLRQQAHVRRQAAAKPAHKLSLGQRLSEPAQSWGKSARFNRPAGHQRLGSLQ